MKIFIVLGIVVLLVILFVFLSNYQSSNLLKSEDKELVQQKIDDLFEISLPRSFSFDPHYNLYKTIQQNGGGYGISQGDYEVYSYYFTRSTYTDLGGNTRRPIVLGLRVYATTQKMLEEESAKSSGSSFDYTYDANHFISENEKISHEDIEFKKSKVTSSLGEATLLVYSNYEKNYRIFVYYVGSKLSELAAQKLLYKTQSSVNILDTLPNAIERISAEYKKNNPDVVKAIEDYRVTENEAKKIAETELIKRYPSFKYKKSELIYAHTHKEKGSKWYTVYYIGKQIGGPYIYILVDVEKDSVLEFTVNE